MSEFKVGQQVLVAEGATWGYSRSSEVRSVLIGEAVTIEAGPDADNDYIVVNEDGVDGYVGGEFLALVGDEAEEPQTGDFQPGDRVRVVDPGSNNPVKAGDTGTVVQVIPSNSHGTNHLVDVVWDNGTKAGLFDTRLEKIEAVNEGKPTVKEGDLVRVIYAAGYTESDYVTPGTLARVIEVPAADPSRPYTRREGSDVWPETFYIDTWEVVTDNIKVGDRVRVLDTPEVPKAWIGKEGGVTDIDTGAEFPVYVTLDNHWRPAAFMFNEVEKVEVTEGDNDTEDTSPLTLDVSNLYISGPHSFAVMGETVDTVNHPPHYKFSNGAEVIDITEHLTFNGGNAVKYVARSTRQDGQNKGNVLEDLRKARWYIDREIERIENEQD